MPLVLAQEPRGEVRALWVQRASLISPTSILSVVEAARDNGFNTLIVQVRGRGDAYYNSRYEPRAATLSNQPVSFDPLEMVLMAGHRAGLSVHAWVNVNLVSDAELPASRQHVVYAHPEWLMVPRGLAPSLDGRDTRSPAYLGQLAAYVRARSDRIEGLFLSPIRKDAADYTVRVIGDLVSRYAVDGVHFDYIRFPNDEFDYNPEALKQFRSDVLPRLSGNERRELSARAQGRAFFYTEMFPERWQQFRRDRLTVLLTRLRAAVKARRPRAMVSAAVFPDAEDAAVRRFQDWGLWLKTGLLDAVCPMAYTTDHEVFRSQISHVEQLAGNRPVWAGIGAFQLPAARAIENIRTARQLGAEGVILFSYDNLNGTYLSSVAKEAFGR